MCRVLSSLLLRQCSCQSTRAGRLLVLFKDASDVVRKVADSLTVGQGMWETLTGGSNVYVAGLIK